MRGMQQAQFSLKEDFNRFCDDARSNNIMLRGKNEEDLTVTISGMTERDIEIIKRYNGTVANEP